MNLTVGLKFTKIMKQIDISPYFYPELNLFLVKNQEIFKSFVDFKLFYCGQYNKKSRNYMKN